MNETQGVAKRVLILSIVREDIQRAADTAGIDYHALVVALKALTEFEAP